MAYDSVEFQLAPKHAFAWTKISAPPLVDTHGWFSNLWTDARKRRRREKRKQRCLPEQKLAPNYASWRGKQKPEPLASH